MSASHARSAARRASRRARSVRNDPQLATEAMTREAQRGVALQCANVASATDDLLAAAELASKAKALIASIGEAQTILAGLEAAGPMLRGMRRVEGGRGSSFIPYLFEPNGTVVYRRARHTRALATFTTPARLAFVKAAKTFPKATAE